MLVRPIVTVLGLVFFFAGIIPTIGDWKVTGVTFLAVAGVIMLAAATKFDPPRTS